MNEKHFPSSTYRDRDISPAITESHTRVCISLISTIFVSVIIIITALNFYSFSLFFK